MSEVPVASAAGPGAPETVESEVDDFRAEFIPRYIEAVDALHNGDPAAWLDLWSPADPVTLMGSLVPSKSGWQDVSRVFRWLGSRFTAGTTLDLDLIAAEVSGDLAYTVAYETSMLSVNQALPTPSQLRVTQIYRREDGEWKLVHRHGDPPPVDRSPVGQAEAT